MKTLKDIDMDKAYHKGDGIVGVNNLRELAKEWIENWKEEIQKEKREAIEHYEEWSDNMRLGSLGRMWTKQDIINELKNNGKDADWFLKMGLHTYEKEGNDFVDTTKILTFDNRAKIEAFKEFFNLEEKSGEYEKE